MHQAQPQVPVGGSINGQIRLAIGRPIRGNKYIYICIFNIIFEAELGDNSVFSSIKIFFYRIKAEKIKAEKNKSSMNMNLILSCDFACFLCYEIQKGDKLKENLTHQIL